MDGQIIYLLRFYVNFISINFGNNIFSPTGTKIAQRNDSISLEELM